MQWPIPMDKWWGYLGMKPAQLYQLMQAKLHKAKLITLHNKIIDPETVEQQQPSPAGIHAYMGLLKHIINKHNAPIRNTQESSSSVGRIKVAASLARKKTDRSNASPFPQGSPSRRPSRKEGCINRQQILHNIMQSSRKLIEINAFPRMDYSAIGNQSERTGKQREEEYRSFVPIGKIYHQLKHKTETAAEYELKPQMNSSANLKLSCDKIEQRKRFSVYAKQTRSAQRSAFRQNRPGIGMQQPMELNAVGIMQPNAGGCATRSQSPTPW